MHKCDEVYTSLCVLFAVTIVLGNLIYQKFVFFSLFRFYTFEISVGAILYPLTFLLIGLITEFYGKEKAGFCVKLGIMTNIIVAIAIACIDSLEATRWSKVDNDLFHKVFGYYSVAFLGSVIACYVAQIVDINIYLWIRKITKNRWLWARNNGSTIISIFIDTFIVISFITFFQILPLDRMVPLVFNSYLYKLSFVILSTPLFYISVRIIRGIQFKANNSRILWDNCQSIKD